MSNTDQVLVEDKTYEKIDFKVTPLVKGEYVSCIFTNCDLSNADLSDIKFVECIFSGCNLSLAVLDRTAFRGVRFIDCKMLGLLFGKCNEFALSFDFKNCTLNLSSFYRMKVKKTIFNQVKMEEVDFTECDLSASTFDNCDFARAIFYHTNLGKTDFRTSFNYSIDPELNQVKKAKFSLSGIGGLLAKYDIEIDRTS